MGWVDQSERWRAKVLLVHWRLSAVYFWSYGWNQPSKNSVIFFWLPDFWPTVIQTFVGAIRKTEDFFGPLKIMSKGTFSRSQKSQSAPLPMLFFSGFQIRYENFDFIFLIFGHIFRPWVHLHPFSAISFQWVFGFTSFSANCIIRLNEISA